MNSSDRFFTEDSAQLLEDLSKLFKQENNLCLRLKAVTMIERKFLSVLGSCSFKIMSIKTAYHLKQSIEYVNESELISTELSRCFFQLKKAIELNNSLVEEINSCEFILQDEVEEEYEALTLICEDTSTASGTCGYAGFYNNNRRITCLRNILSSHLEKLDSNRLIVVNTNLLHQLKTYLYLVTSQDISAKIFNLTCPVS